MVIFYKKWKKYNEIQLTKNKMDLNIRKMTKHPPSPGNLLSLYGPTFHVTPVDVCITVYSNVAYIYPVSCLVEIKLFVSNTTELVPGSPKSFSKRPVIPVGTPLLSNRKVSITLLLP